MLVRDILERTLLETGQYITASSNEFNIDRFLILIKSCLGTYNQYCPFDEKFQLTINDLRYTFHEASHRLGPPKWISEIIPVRLAGVHPWYFRESQEWTNRELEYKKQFPWDYQGNTLYVPIQSVYQIHGVWDHKVTEVAGLNQKEEKQYEVTTIDFNDDELLDLISAKFLAAVGRNRRAFTLQDLPIQTDAAELVSEGLTLEKDVLEELQNKKNKWYLSWR